MTIMNIAKLKQGREKSVRNFHPWIFSGAIASISGKPSPGEIVKVTDSKGDFLAYGYYNSKSQISIRILEWDENKIIDEIWWKDKLAQSINKRNDIINSRTNAYRLVYAESDGLPGLIIDKYADWLVIQVLTAGINRVKETITNALVELINPEGIIERSDVEVRSLEGLEPKSGVIYGKRPPEILTINENGLKFIVDLSGGQKTGFYLDQRENRKRVAEFVSGRDILDCFSHTGAFSVYALKTGAKSATILDSSGECLTIAKENILQNGLDLARAKFVEGDAFELLRNMRSQQKLFDMVILDPPKFAKNKSYLKKALAGYKDINMLGMQLVKPGGYLTTFSCSGAVGYGTLKTVLFWAAVDSQKHVSLIHDLYQAPCHPRLSTFPESEYLKGFLCRIDR